MTVKTKKFIAKPGEVLKESIPEWRKRMKKENPNFKETGNSLYLSEKGGTSTVQYTE